MIVEAPTDEAIVEILATLGSVGNVRTENESVDGIRSGCDSTVIPAIAYAGCPRDRLLQRPDVPDRKPRGFRGHPACVAPLRQ